ncbi:zinc knuckle CX2CX4HX4C containing protein [Tanacetum coccineum]
MESSKNARQSLLKMDHRGTHYSIIPLRKLNTFLLSGFSNNERQETDESGMAEALAALEATLKIKKVPQEEKKNVNYYVDPYEPPIPFPRRLKHHAKEALVHKTMESLKKIKINRPLLKEIRQMDNYAKHMKDLVANKPRTQEDEENIMNPRLDFNNALAHLGASISVMPMSMYKRLDIGKLKPINMVIEMADNTKCTPKGIIENLLIKVDNFIFLIDFVILDMVEDFRMPIILGRPLLATAHAKVDIFRKSISLEVGNEKVIFKMRSSFTTMIFESVRSIKNETCPKDDDFKKIDYDLFLYDSESLLASCDPNYNVCDGGGLPINKEKRYWESINDSKREELEWEELSLNDWMKIRYGKVCEITRERILKRSMEREVLRGRR